MKATQTLAIYETSLEILRMTFRLTPITDSPASGSDWVWAPYVPAGALTILEGDPGTNKSTLIYDLAARLSSGRPMPDSSVPSVPGDVWLISPEDTAARIRKTLESSGANLEKIHVLDSHSATGPHFPTDIASFEAAVRQNPPRLVSLDPLSECLEGNTTSERAIRAALSPLCSMAAKYKFALMGVRHLTKTCTRNPLYRGGGSIALIALARSSLLVMEDPFQAGQRVLVQVKSSMGSPAFVLGFRPVELAGGLSVNWLGRMGYTADQLFAAQRETEAKAVEEALYVLYSLLGDGPILAKEAYQLGRESGVSQRTLRRAKELLGVRSIRRGFGRGSQFFWKLPEKNELLQRLHELDLDLLMGKLLTGDDDTPNANVPHEDLSDPMEDSPRQARHDIDGDDEEDDPDPANWWK